MGDLTDKELKNLKPRAKLYKVTDRDGMHAAVTPTGVISFRYQYRVNGRQESVEGSLAIERRAPEQWSLQPPRPFGYLASIALRRGDHAKT